MQAPPDGGTITLSAAKYAALRQSLAAAILKARTDAAAEAARWRAEAEAARAEAEALREGLVRDLALERAAPLSLPAAVEKVAAACGAIDRHADADARHASFLRQGAMTHVAADADARRTPDAALQRASYRQSAKCAVAAARARLRLRRSPAASAGRLLATSPRCLCSCSPPWCAAVMRA